MGLKILHTADLHLDSPFAGFSEAQRQLLRQQQKLLPGKIADLCRRENCDLLLLAGDIFDGQPTRDTIGILKEALSRCGVPVFVSPGNHDFCSPEKSPTCAGGKTATSCCWQATFLTDSQAGIPSIF